MPDPSKNKYNGATHPGHSDRRIPQITTSLNDPSDIVPLLDYVVVELIEADETPGGIYVGASANDNTQRGLVLAIGPGRWSEFAQRHVPIENLEIGDVVVFPHFKSMPPSEFRCGNKELRAVSALDIKIKYRPRQAPVRESFDDAGENEDSASKIVDAAGQVA